MRHVNKKKKWLIIEKMRVGCISFFMLGILRLRWGTFLQELSLSKYVTEFDARILASLIWVTWPCELFSPWNLCTVGICIIQWDLESSSVSCYKSVLIGRVVTFFFFFNRKTIGVFCCGPSKMSKILHKLSNSSNPYGTRFEYNKESFSWKSVGLGRISRR